MLFVDSKAVAHRILTWHVRQENERRSQIRSFDWRNASAFAYLVFEHRQMRPQQTKLFEIDSHVDIN